MQIKVFVLAILKTTSLCAKIELSVSIAILAIILVSSKAKCKQTKVNT